MRGIYEINEIIDRLIIENNSLKEEVGELKELVFAQGKTLEGIQHLFVKAGEYRGKPRGRLPR